MFIEVLLLSFFLVRIQGGELKNIDKIHIKYWYLIVVGFFIQIVSFFFVSISRNDFSEILKNNYGHINLLTYLLIIMVLVYNGKYKGFKLMAVGNILNFIAMLGNGGRMPVYIGCLQYRGLERQKELLMMDGIMTHGLMDRGKGLFLLGDIIPIPKPYILPKVISIGDIFLGIGLIIFIVWISKEEAI